MTQNYEPLHPYSDWPLTPYSPLFVHAPPRRQRQAATDFVSAIEPLVLAGRETRFVPDDYIVDRIENGYYTDDDWGMGSRCQDILRAKVDEYIVDDPRVIVATAIACYDHYLADNIQADHDHYAAFVDKSNEYFRATPHHQVFARAIARIALSMDANRKLIVGIPAHIRDYAASEGIEGLGLMTPDLAFMIVDEDELPSPPIGVPRQVLFASLLRCGINPLSHLKSDKIEDSFANKGLPRRYYADQTLGNGHWLNWENENLQRRYTACSHFWGEILNHKEENSIANLFSSGTAANEAAMRAVAALTDGAAFMHEYWYHENIDSIGKLFKKAKSVEEAKVLLVNLEPVSYFRFQGDVLEPQDAIQRFIDTAQQNPEQVCYLIADMTVNPFYILSFDLLYDRVPNLEVIKTMSVTKYQNGARRYFFGAAHTSNLDIALQLEKVSPFVGGEMNDYRILHFPLSPLQDTDVDAVQERRRQITQRNHCLLDLNPEKPDGWQVKPYSYFSYLIPPEQFVRRVAELMAGHDDPRHPVLNPVNEAIAKAIKQTVLSTGAMDLGQSFGLRHTRINPQGCITEVDGSHFRLRIPRLCPGYESGAYSLYQATAFLIGQLNAIEIDSLMQED